MIVVDSSIWINLLRGVDTPGTRTLEGLVSPTRILVGDLILLEVVQGARKDMEADRLERHLTSFLVRPMLGRRHAIQAARAYRKLRSLGISVRKTADLIIATFCLEEGHDLLTDDRDFQPFADHLGLRLL